MSNAVKMEIEVDTTNATRNVRELQSAMKALSRSTNAVPITRVEWLAIAFILSQTIGNIALLIIALRFIR